jgi:hypothetical protein
VRCAPQHQQHHHRHPHLHATVNQQPRVVGRVVAPGARTFTVAASNASNSDVGSSAAAAAADDATTNAVAAVAAAASTSTCAPQKPHPSPSSSEPPPAVEYQRQRDDYAGAGACVPADGALPPGHIVLVDGMSLIFRSFYGWKNRDPMLNSAGDNNSVVFSVANTMLVGGGRRALETISAGSQLRGVKYRA